MNKIPLTRDEAIRRLQTVESEIRRFGVRRLALFGSVLRNEGLAATVMLMCLSSRSGASHAQMRDHLIHGYFEVDYQLVWDVVYEKIPQLKRSIHGSLIHNRPNHRVEKRTQHASEWPDGSSEVDIIDLRYKYRSARSIQ